MVIPVTCLLGCLFCLWIAARGGVSRFYSTYAAYSSQLDDAETAVRFSSSDPEAHLIRAAILKGAGRLDEAVQEYEEAAQLRPRDYVLWLELGLARDEAEDQAGAINALREAVRLAPDYAAPRWQLGNILLRSGNINDAFSEMRRAAASDPALLPQLIDLAWTIYQGETAAVERVVQPQTSAARLALARFAARHGKAVDAARIFRTLGDVAAEDRRALLVELLAAKQFNVAYEVWSTAPGRSEHQSNFTDGGFEEQVNLDEPGFGWQVARNLPALKVSLDQAQPHQGRNSLRLDWSGETNPASPVISQTVLVEPNARYRLRFSVRTEELVSGGLPFIAVSDASSKDSHALTQSDPFPSKTASWQDKSVDFTTGKDAQAVVVTLQRQNCDSNPCPIFGRVWLDDFSLQKL
ncbi:MAG: hypothetical protein QOC96_611 [Acidobacteriota bacterium]|jgi:Flp pilus assembly protein TadD|nr:hypothetical protein [Acidobacteriota bacterium]